MQVNDVKDIFPQVVVMSDVAQKASLLIGFKHKSFIVANETNIVHVIVICWFLISKGGEGIYNNTKNDIQTDDVNNDLECGVME